MHKVRRNTALQLLSILGTCLNEAIVSCSILKVEGPGQEDRHRIYMAVSMFNINVLTSNQIKIRFIAVFCFHSAAELLKIIYDEYKRNKIEDAYFVPVSVSYELVPDVDDVFGVSKSVKGGVLSAIKAYLYDLIFPNPLKARVRVDYAQPTSFRVSCYHNYDLIVNLC